ncbi:MAG: glutamate racemase [Sphingomonadaceae bacterium]
MPSTVDPSAPVLLFDSGVGGLSVLAALREVLPDAPVIYAADVAGLPYGTKSEAQVTARVAGLLGRMSERYRPRLACIACNTASTIALGMVREVLEIPVVGTVPAIKPAAALTHTGVIGLLGTEATLRQSYVDELERAHAASKTLLRHAAPELVTLAEARLRGGVVPLDAVRRAVSGLLDHPRAGEIDTVVLACTHFPLLRDELAALFGPVVTLVDGAQGIARRIATLTEGQAFQRREPDLAVTTGSLDEFRSLASRLCELGLARIEKF